MKKDFNDKVIAIVEMMLEHLRGFILVLVVVISILGVVVGYKYYNHTQQDPEFCTSCHIMKEAFREWQRGKHKDIVCQKCHHLTLIEQNQLLISYVLTGRSEFSQTHGRKKPWIECKNCHLSEMAQGSVTLRKSYGHAKHVFMLNIECKVCHGKSLHLFKPDENACQNCHKDKGVHGVGMEAFSCLKCHSYAEKSPAMVAKERCLRCHQLPVTGPMSTFQCFKCHKPHGKIKLKSEDCLGECHPHEAQIGQHGFHMKKGVTCLDCHKAHKWVVTQQDAKTLCKRCHQPKDPKTFIF